MMQNGMEALAAAQSAAVLQASAAQAQVQQSAAVQAQVHSVVVHAQIHSDVVDAHLHLIQLGNNLSIHVTVAHLNDSPFFILQSPGSHSLPSVYFQKVAVHFECPVHYNGILLDV